MNIKNRLIFQKGGALIIALLVISVAAVVTMTSMRGSMMQEKMVANQNAKAISFMAAETGAASFNKWLKDPNTTWNSSTWQNTIPTTAAGSPNIGTRGYYWIDPNDVVWTSADVTVKVRGYTKSDNSSAAAAKTTLKITMTKPTAGSSATYIGGSGLISGGDININGKKTLNGNIHANKNVNLNGNTTINGGIVTASGIINANNVSASLLQSNTPTVDIPAVTDAYLNQLKGQAAASTCNINLSGDQGGKIYYCNGNAVISGNFSNATIVSTGDVSKNGSGQQGGAGKSNSAVTVAIIAKGNVNFNGSNNDYSVVWTNGDYNHNGSGSVKGSIVARGNINRNGAFNFQELTEVANNQITTSSTPSGPSRVTLWQEILE